MFEAELKRWYVVYSKPHREEYTQFHLRLRELESFFPRLHLPGSPKKRNRIIPLFPNYLFVRIRLSAQYHHVIWSPGVKYLIGYRGNPAPLDDDTVAFLMNKANEDGIIAAQPNINVGQTVTINTGPFAGLVAIIREPPDAKGRVKLLLNLLKRQISLEAPIEYIETGWIAKSSKAKATEKIGMNFRN